MDNKKQVMQHLDRFWNQGDFDRVDDYLSSDFHYKTTFTAEILNRTQYIGFIQQFRDAIPDIRIDVDLIMAEEDHVMTQVSFFGIVEKPVYGIPPSTKVITFHAISIWEIRANRIVSLDTLIDIAGLERQLGLSVAALEPLKVRQASQPQ